MKTIFKAVIACISACIATSAFAYDYYFPSKEKEKQTVVSGYPANKPVTVRSPQENNQIVKQRRAERLAESKKNFDKETKEKQQEMAERFKEDPGSTATRTEPRRAAARPAPEPVQQHSAPSAPAEDPYAVGNFGAPPTSGGGGSSSGGQAQPAGGGGWGIQY